MLSIGTKDLSFAQGDERIGDDPMLYRPFGFPRQALLATALALIWFHPPMLSEGGRSFLSRATSRDSSDINKSARSAYLSAEGVSSSQREALPFVALQAPSQTGAMTEIRALFAEFLKLHAAKKMDEWRDRMFLSEAVCFRATPDGQVAIFPVAELARTIAEEAKSLDEQHETFEDVRIEVHGNAAHYATSWTLFHNGKVARKGRAFFSLVKKEGAWKIASLVWYRE
jgi:hypothetical protein